jgi:outer membrane protein assembly factor BamB
MGAADKPVVIVDPSGQKPPVELRYPARIGTPIVEGSWMYLLELKKSIDEKQKVKRGGFEEPRKVQELILHAINLREMKEVFSHTFDTSSKTHLWEYIEGHYPILVRKENLYLFTYKKGFPINAKREVDESKPLSVATFTIVPRDPAKGKPTSSDIPELLGAGVPIEAGDYLLWQEGSGSRKILFYNHKQRKMRQEMATPNQEALVGAVGRLAYVAAGEALGAYEYVGPQLQPSKGSFPISLKQGRVERLEERWLVVRRLPESGRPALEFYEPTSGKRKFAIPYAAATPLTWIGTHGKYLLCTDSRPALMAYNAANGEPFWIQDKFPPSTGLSVARAGNTLYVTHSDRLYAVDLHTGNIYWSVKTPGLSGILAAGRSPVGTAFKALLFVRETPLPPGAVVPASDGVPPTVRLGTPWLAPPAVEGDALRTMDAEGRLHSADLKTQTWEPPAAMIEQALPTPLVARGPLILSVGNKGLTIFDREQKKAVAAYTLGTQTLPLEPTLEGDVLYLREFGSLLAYDLKARKELWKVPYEGSRSYPGLAEGKIYAMSGPELWVLNAVTGKFESKTKLLNPGPYDSVRLDAEKRVLLMNRGEGLWRRSQTLERDSWAYVTKPADPQAAASFPGWLLVLPDRYLYSHAGGAVVAINPADGKELWKVETPKFTSFLRLHKEVVYFADLSGKLRGVKAADGKDAFAPIEVGVPERFTPLVWNDAAWFWSSDGYLVPGK